MCQERTQHVGTPDREGSSPQPAGPAVTGLTSTPEAGIPALLELELGKATVAHGADSGCCLIRLAVGDAEHFPQKRRT